MDKADLLAKTKIELLKVAQRHGLRGVSTLKKEELADKIYSAQQRFKSSMAKATTEVETVSRKIADDIKRRAVRKRAAEAAVQAKESAMAKKTVARPLRRTKVAAKLKGLKIEGNGDVVGHAEELSAHKFDVTRSPAAATAGFSRRASGRIARCLRHRQSFSYGARPALALRVLGPQLAADGRLPESGRR